MLYLLISETTSRKSHIQRLVLSVSYPVMHNIAMRTGTMMKYHGLSAMNFPSLKNALLRVLSTQDRLQGICKGENTMISINSTTRKLRAVKNVENI